MSGTTRQGRMDDSVIQVELPLQHPIGGNWAGDEDPEQEQYRIRLVPKKTIKLAVSGAVLISEIEREIIDTPSFQRLRGIRQLGAVCLVYPTALHTRFDHSIGTLGVVAEMVAAIRANEHNSPSERRITRKEETLARLYALLHDVTHVPFGHTIEDELGIFERHDENEGRIQHFLGPESEVGKIIVREYGPEFLDLLLDIYCWNEDPNLCAIPAHLVFIHDLVSNTVCADLLDYLRRDSHFCNLGVDMEYHFLNFLYLKVNKETKFKHVFVRLWKKEGRPRRDVLSDLCRVLEARYLIAERVYYHHAKIIAGTMLTRSLQESALIGEITEDAIREHSDDTLVQNLALSASPLAKELGIAYRERRLYRCIREYRDEDIQKAQAESHENKQLNVINAKVGTAKNRRDFENSIAACVGVEDGDFLLYAPQRKMNMKEAEMKVFWSGETMPFKDIDDVIVKSRLDAILSAHARLWSIKLLAKRTLSEEQISLARDIVDTELFVPVTDVDRKRHDYVIRIIEDRLTHCAGVPLSEHDRHVRMEACVQEILAPHKHAGNLRDVIESAVKEHFVRRS